MTSRRSAIEPIAIVGTSLVSNSVAQFPPDRSGEFSNLFADAMESARSGRRNSGRRKGYGYSDLEPGSGHPEAEPLKPPPSLLQYNNSVDLYVQLDTLLREKSVLIAIV